MNVTNESMNARIIEHRLMTAAVRAQDLAPEFDRMALQVRNAYRDGYKGPESESVYTDIVAEAIRSTTWDIANLALDSLIKTAHLADIGRNAGS